MNSKPNIKIGELHRVEIILDYRKKPYLTLIGSKYTPMETKFILVEALAQLANSAEEHEGVKRTYYIERVMSQLSGALNDITTYRGEDDA